MHSPAAHKRWKLLSTAVYCAAFAALGLAFSALGPTLPGLADNTRSTLSDISFLFVARGIGSMVGSVWGGRLMDRLPGHHVISAALFGSLALTALTPFVSRVWLLAAVQLATGITHGMMNVGGNALLIWLHGRSVAPYMNVTHFFFGVGTFLSPLLLAQTLQLPNGLEWSYTLLAIAILPAAAMPLLLKSPQPEVVTAQAEGKPTHTLLIALITFIFFGYASASSAFGGWVFTYATRLNLADTTTAAYLTSLFWGALTAGRLFSIPFTARIAPGRVLLVDLLGSLAAVVAMSLFPGSLVVLAVGSAGLGFFLATIFPTTMSLAGRSMPITGKVTSVFSVGSSLGALLIPWLVGQFFESSGAGVLMSLLLLDLVLTLGVFILLNRRLKQTPSKAP